MRAPFIRLTIPAAALALAACAGGTAGDGARDDTAPDTVIAGRVAPSADGVALGVSSSGARFVHTIAGLQGPESVRYDPDQDVFFVSNMTGYGSTRDGNGFISVIDAARPDSVRVFVTGGVNGAVLDAPKGMVIHGDTLWVADIGALRGFDRHNGRPLATHDLTPQGAVLLNDVAVGPDGTLRVTDTGILMSPKGVIHTGPDRIFTIGAGGAVAEMASGPDLHWPNGITWDSAGRRWIVVSFDPYHGQVASMSEPGAARRVLRDGAGHLDGVEVLTNGDILFTSWADSSVHLLRGGVDRPIVREVPEAADIGVDTRRNRLAIPLSVLGRVQLWALPPADAAPAATVQQKR